MTYANRLTAVCIAFAILALIVPMETVAGYNLPQETDVTILRQYWYLENGIIRDGGTSGRRAPTYHDLAVTPTETEVTFHNHIEIHDERVESTQYYLEFRIEVFEEIDGNSYFVDSKLTATIIYSPPNEIYHYQTIYIDVDYAGIDYHIYNVKSRITRFEIKYDNSYEWLSDVGYGVNALVHELEDLDDFIGCETGTI